MAGIYIHVPFCVRKCTYCDFASRPLEEGLSRLWREGVRREFALVRETTWRSVLDEAKTVYVGGGTPTVLPPAELQSLLSLLEENIDGKRLVEFTVEANPGTLTEEKAGLLRDGGVTRVSLGVQTFDEDLLHLLGRAHNPEDVAESVALLRKGGVDSLNMDLIYGLPGQDRRAFHRDLEILTSFEPDHVSLYALSVEEGTPLDSMVKRGLSLPGDEEVEAMFRQGRALLEERGYHHYEVSNFSLPGRECLHNRGYWTGENYLGIGPSAAGFIFLGREKGAVRYRNARDLESYLKFIEEGKLPREEELHLPPEEVCREILILGLRLREGVDLTALTGQFGPLPEDAARTLDNLLERGLLEEEGGFVRVPEKFLFTMNFILRELV